MLVEEYLVWIIEWTRGKEKDVTKVVTMIDWFLVNNYACMAFLVVIYCTVIPRMIYHSQYQ